MELKDQHGKDINTEVKILLGLDKIVDDFNGNVQRIVMDQNPLCHALIIQSMTQFQKKFARFKSKIKKDLSSQGMLSKEYIIREAKKQIQADKEQTLWV